MNAVTRRFVACHMVSILGDRIAQVSIPLALYATTRSTSAAGVAAAANQLPGVALAPVAGRLTDRMSRKHLTVLADGARAGCYGVLGAVFLLDPPGIVVPVALLLLVAGTFDTLAGVAHVAWLPALAERSGLMRANAMLEGSDALVTVAGPPLGGLMLDVFGRAGGCFVDAATFAVSAVGLSRLPRDARSNVDDTGTARATGGGLRFIAVDRRQRRIQSMIVGTYLATGAMVLMVLAIGTEELGLSPTAAALAVSGAGVGGIVASFLVAPRVGRCGLRPLCVGIYVTIAVAFVIIARAEHPLATFAGMLIGDGAITLSFIVLGTYRQTITPYDRLGRVTGTSAAIGSLTTATAAAAAGWAMSVLGIRTAIALWPALLLPALVGAWTQPVRTIAIDAAAALS